MGYERASVTGILKARLQQCLPGWAGQRAMAPPWTDPLAPPRTGAPASLRVETLPQGGGAADQLGYRSAAVLLQLFPHRGSWYTLVIERTEEPGPHSRQLALPGGGFEAGEDAYAAALRENHEELGIDPGLISVLGSLTTVAITISRYYVYPVVGFLPRLPALAPNPREVASVILLPLAVLGDPEARSTFRFERFGRMWDVPCYSWEGRIIWGATAQILAEFSSVVDSLDLPAPQEQLGQ